MDGDFKELLQRVVDQIDVDEAAGDEISQELWELKVESKLAIKNSESRNSPSRSKKLKS